MKRLAQRQIAAKLGKIQELKTHLEGVPSWIQYIRNAVGMTPLQLASRMGIAKSSLHQIERQEALDKTNIQTLKRAAEALGCEFIYAIVPRSSIEVLINEQAEKKARSIIKAATIQMEYEDQTVDAEETEEQFKELLASIKASKKLWEEG